jgi:hypothetical protein
MKDGITLMMIAASQGNIGEIDRLINEGANTEIMDNVSIRMLH